MVGGDHAEDDGPGLGDIPERHVFGDVVDVWWLLSDGDGGDSGEVDDGEVGAGLGEDIEDDGLVDDLLALAADLISHEVDAGAHLVEVGELLLHALLHDLVEFGVGGGEGGDVVHSQLERPPRDDALG